MTLKKWFLRSNRKGMSEKAVSDHLSGILAL